MIRSRYISYTSLLLFLLSFLAQGEELRLKINPGAPNLVSFISQAPLETIEGKTNRISGWISFDPQDLTKPVSSDILVDMASLDTDNRIRNGHMRDNHLHTDRYPNSRFVLTQILVNPGTPIKPNEQVSFNIKGNFTLHGVTRTIQPEVTALWAPDQQTLEVTARFTVRLTDSALPRPQFLIMKLDEDQKVTVKFRAVRE